MRLKMPQSLIYRTVESVLGVFREKHADCTEAVNSLLEIYDKAQDSYNQIKNDAKPNKPLIILEGLDGCGKSSVGHRLAKKLNAVEWCTPPESIKPLRNLFDEHKELKVAYYALGNYIAACEVGVLLKNSSVVMDRYWHSTCAYAYAQAIHDFPEEVSLPADGDPFYTWPKDMLKPSCVFFLNVDESVRIERISRRTVITKQETLLRENDNFRNNVITIYKRMKDPNVTFVNANLNFGGVLGELQSKIDELQKSDLIYIMYCFITK